MSSPLRIILEVDSPQSHHSRRQSISDRRCCLEMYERSDSSSLSACIDMKCSTTRPTTSSYMFTGGKHISFGLLKHEAWSANSMECKKVCLRKRSEEWQGCITQVETCNTNVRDLACFNLMSTTFRFDLTPSVYSLHLKTAKFRVDPNGSDLIAVRMGCCSGKKAVLRPVGQWAW